MALSWKVLGEHSARHQPCGVFQQSHFWVCLFRLQDRFQMFPTLVNVVLPMLRALLLQFGQEATCAMMARGQRLLLLHPIG